MTSPYARPTAPAFPPGRYGHRRDPARRWRRVLVTATLALLVAAAGVAIAVKLFQQYDQAPYQVIDAATTEVTGTTVTVAFDVTVPAGEGASCTVIAQTRTGERVGQVLIAVPPPPDGGTRAHVTATLPTTKPAFVGSVPGCGPPR